VEDVLGVAEGGVGVEFVFEDFADCFANEGMVRLVLEKGLVEERAVPGCGAFAD
jgi:hypothetical protein